MNILDKTRLFQTSILSSLIMGFGGTVYAQVEQIPDPIEQELSSQDEVVVTGSRIRRRGIETVFPTTSLDAADLEDRAFTNISDALTEIPAFGNGLTDSGTQGSQDVGRNFVDFLDLGTARTLVLVDGKRFVSSASLSVFGTNGLQVDLNAVPTALIDRVDTIGIGGAPIYGADAIAGTVNVILKDDFEGLDASTQYSITEQGDADVFQAQLVAGANFADDRGNVTFSAEYETQQGLTELDRPGIFNPENSYFTSRIAGSSGSPDDADFVPGQRGLYNNRLINLFTNGGTVSLGGAFLGVQGVGAIGGEGLLQFTEGGELVTFNAGQSIPGQNAFFASGGDGSNLFQETQSLQTPAERIVGTSRFNYEFNDRVSANAELMFSNNTATEEVNQGGFQSFPFGGTSASPRLSINNPLLTAQARNRLIAGGVNPDGGQFFIHRLNNDIVNSGPSKLETSLWRFSGGLEGNFDIGNKQFFWDVSFTHGESDVETISTAIIDTAFLNALDVVRLSQADIDNAGGIDSINAISGITVGLGDPVCQSVIDAATGNLTGSTGAGLTDGDLPFVQGCAPLNLFGFGQATPEALNFVTGLDTLTSDITSQQFVANLSGSLFELPAGDLAFNIGYERRNESGRFTPSIFAKTAQGRSAASLPNAGAFRTQEYYGEVSVPLVSEDMGIPLIQNLQFEGAYRHIDVNTLEQNTKAFTVGGTYSPIEDITFRGNYTESTRLPGIVDLFAPTTGAFSSGADPCDSRTLSQANDVALRTANCIAGGVADPTTFISNIQNATVFGRTGGNPNLVPEETEAWTIGAELNPRFIPNLRMQADYMNVKIPGAISGVSVAQLLAACYDSTSFPNDPSCANITRDTAAGPNQGQVIDFLTGPANAGLFDTEFVQFQASYFYDVSEALDFVGGLFGKKNTPSSDAGTLTHNLSVFSPLKRDFAVGDENPDLNATRGGYGDPNVSANFATNWQKDNLRLFWGVLWQDNPLVTSNPSNTDEYFLFPTPLNITPGQNGFDADGRLPSSQASRYGDGSQFIHNASVSYNLEDVIGTSDTTLQLSVSNVFNRKPSLIENALGDFNQSQILGRTYTMRVNARF